MNIDCPLQEICTLDMVQHRYGHSFWVNNTLKTEVPTMNFAQIR